MKRTPKPVLAFAVLGLGLLALPGPGLPPSPWPPEEPRPYVLLVGTVFTSEGFSLPGVRVSIKRKEDRKPKWRAVSDRRGEFAVRLPPEPATYEVTTHSPDYEDETKTVVFAGDQRVELIFRLPKKKNERRED